MEDTTFLRDLLEKILFDEKELIKLKDGITQLVSGTLSSREFRERIIHLRTALLEELMKFYPYYLNQWSKKNSFSKDQNHDKDQQLEERDSLLEMIETRLQRLYEKLNS